MQALGWDLPAERFALAAVWFGADDINRITTVDGQVGTLGEVLPKRAVRVLV